MWNFDFYKSVYISNVRKLDVEIFMRSRKNAYFSVEKMAFAIFRKANTDLTNYRLLDLMDFSVRITHITRTRTHE